MCKNNFNPQCFEIGDKVLRVKGLRKNISHEIGEYGIVTLVYGRNLFVSNYEHRWRNTKLPKSHLIIVQKGEN